MTITNLPSYGQQYVSSAYHHLAAASSQHPHHPQLHPAHPHAHHQPQHAAYSTHPSQYPQSHVLAGPIRTEPVTRKRPKYTRSKTGCLTCRVKKIKCDETKPNCTRCTHGQRECTWPENVPTRKKATTKKSETDEKSPISNDGSLSPSPSTGAPRDGSPPRRSPFDNGILSESRSRTHSEPSTVNASPLVSPVEPATQLSRRPSLQENHNPSPGPYNTNSQQVRGHTYHSLTPPTVSPVSFHHPSPSSPHDYAYNGSGVNGQRHELPAIQTSQPRLTDLGVDSGHGMNGWQTASMLPSAVDNMDPYYRSAHERGIVPRPTTYT
ncbi:hypothetical protein M422DRAFT_66083, partial [Sphaerobolus stellatus SS14]